MANAVENVVYCLRTIIVRITLGPISFVFLELSKFVLVLVLAFWIAIGIFMMWESLMPEAAGRLSAAAAAVVANSSGLMPSTEGKDNANESGTYPFVVDLPKTESSTLETIIKDETLLTAAEGKSSSLIKDEPPRGSAKEEANKSEEKSPSILKNEAETAKEAEVASTAGTASKQPSAASEVGDTEKPAA
ncbi:uncharacterized protein LOC105209471 isoform X1 [Zeugodacus cucurbitae]|uniref:Protein TKR n=1 Tax=Zeugodacus cucurbitae TaxID=28588 RepID=A0A0A1WEN2_ZEUCU|nr:uncharacterized protein LOC105209471 isoform X1 [Zeugodacus cucurbitae]